MRIKKRLVRGEGVNDYEGSIRIGGALIGAYKRWENMLQRCYDTTFLEKNPTYKGCSVSPEWLHFNNFKAWYDVYYREGYQLDKDILHKGNKVYSAHRCCFVPNTLNMLLVNRKAARGNFPIGVHYYLRNNNFQAYLRVHGKRKHLGYFKTEIEAFNVYKIAKETQIQTLATEYYNRCEIGLNVYTALINYKVEIPD